MNMLVIIDPVIHYDMASTLYNILPGGASYTHTKEEDTKQQKMMLEKGHHGTYL